MICMCVCNLYVTAWLTFRGCADINEVKEGEDAASRGEGRLEEGSDAPRNEKASGLEQAERGQVWVRRRSGRARSTGTCSLLSWGTGSQSASAWLLWPVRRSRGPGEDQDGAGG